MHNCRMLIKMCSPSVSSHFAFSNATQSESENNKSESGENKDGKETEPTKFSLKEGNTRLRSMLVGIVFIEER